MASIMTNERSLNLKKLTAPVTKAAIPVIIAHNPTIHLPIFQVFFSASEDQEDRRQLI